MKHLIAATVLALAGCAHPPAQPWKQDAAAHLENYKLLTLRGQNQSAESEFRQAVRAIKQGSDPELLGRAYLTRCAIESATLRFSDCGPYAEIAGIAPSPANNAYWRLLLVRSPDAADIALLPSSYQAFARDLAAGQADRIRADVAAITDPVSQLIAAALAVRAGSADTALLELAAATSRFHGWLAVTAAFQMRQAELLTKDGRLQEAEHLRNLIKVFEK